MADSTSPEAAKPVFPVPAWFRRLSGFGLALLRPILPPRWLTWLEHGAWFIAVGMFNTLLGYLMFVAFLNWLHMGRVAALMLAYGIGIFIAYYNFSRYVFTGGSQSAWMRFAPVYLLIYACNQGLLELFVRASGWSEELCQFLLLPVIALLSYVFNRLLVFRI
jgi:putative flippase GtrA